MEHEQLVQLTADIVAAHVANNKVAFAEVGDLIAKIHGALTDLGGQTKAHVDERKPPAVSVRSSVKPDYLVCLECGRRQMTLKRHLAAAHGLTPHQYRSDYGLPDGYPMIAQNYASRRREMALKSGLGQTGRGRAAPSRPAAAESATSKGRGRSARRKPGSAG
jgi:predicted transcriptional regulator